MREHVAKGFCDAHYRQWRKRGDPVARHQPPSAAERLHEQYTIVRSTGCHQWDGHRNRDGYGVLQVDNKKWLAHRLAWTLAHGPIPEGLSVCHECDNPACFNVEHLKLGTQAENLKDQRDRKRKPMGSSAFGAKLTKEQVIEIRRRYALGGITQRALAVEFGVHIMTINHVVLRKNYANI